MVDDPRDRPAKIEVTPAMAKVGSDLVWALNDDEDGPLDGLDDNEVAQFILRAMLRAGGYQVAEKVVKVPSDVPQYTERQRRLLGSQLDPLPPDFQPINPRRKNTP